MCCSRQLCRKEQAQVRTKVGGAPSPVWRSTACVWHGTRKRTCKYTTLPPEPLSNLIGPCAVLFGGGEVLGLNLDVLLRKAFFPLSTKYHTVPVSLSLLPLFFRTRIFPLFIHHYPIKLIACIRATRDASLCHEFRDEVERCGVRMSQRMLRAALSDDWF